MRLDQYEVLSSDGRDVFVLRLSPHRHQESGKSTGCSGSIQNGRKTLEQVLGVNKDVMEQVEFCDFIR